MTSKRFSGFVRLLGLALVIAVLFGPMTAISEVEGADAVAVHGWQSIGPAPGAIAAPVVANAASHTIYMGAISGPLLKSSDGGASFAAVESWPWSGSLSLAMDPHDPEVVYAGAFKTTDGGETWIDMGLPLGLCTVIDPTNPSVLYTSFVGVFKSVDGGLTWEESSEGLGAALIFSMSIDPFHPEVILAATNGEGLFRSTDAGATWSPIDAIGATVWTVLFDPHDEGVVWAGSDGDGVYKSTDGGDTFARVGSPAVGVLIALAKSGGRLFAGTGNYGVSVSDDGGVTWKNAHVTRAKSLILSVDEAGGVYLGTHFDGAYMLPAANVNDVIIEGNARVTAEDFERHGGWRRIGWDLLRRYPGQDGHSLAMDPSDHRHLYFTTNDGGLHETEDGGRTWKDAGVNGFTVRTARSVAFDPQQPRRIYATTFVGGGLFRSKDRGRHWERRLFGSPTTYSTGMAVDPVDHTVYIATLGGGIALDTNGLWKTADFGETFTRIDRAPGAGPDEFLDFNGRGIAIDPRHRNVLLFGDRNTGIWRSKDFGKSWVNVYDTPGMFFITFDPTDSRIVYCATLFQGVLKSTNGGLTWRQKSAGLPQEDPADPDTYFRTTRAGGVQVDPQNHRTLYVGIEGEGVFKSRNGGETWYPANLGLEEWDVRGLQLDPVNPKTLYLSTFTSVYKTTTGGE